MNKISRNELVNKIRNIQGTTFANLTYFVDESKSRKVKGNYVLQKEVTVNITINAKYENKVNRILENKQGETPSFEAQCMKGKTYSFNDCRSIVENKYGNKMLYCMIENRAPRLTTYFHNDCVITKDKAIKLDLFTPSFFKQSNTVGRGTVSDENNFYVMTPSISSIKRIKLSGVEYHIVD